MALTLFNLALEYVIRNINIDTSSTIMYRTTQILAYADDINIIGRTANTVTKERN